MQHHGCRRIATRYEKHAAHYLAMLNDHIPLGSDPCLRRAAVARGHSRSFCPWVRPGLCAALAAFEMVPKSPEAAGDAVGHRRPMMW